MMRKKRKYRVYILFLFMQVSLQPRRYVFVIYRHAITFKIYFFAQTTECKLLHLLYFSEISSYCFCQLT